MWKWCDCLDRRVNVLEVVVRCRTGWVYYKGEKIMSTNKNYYKISEERLIGLLSCEAEMIELENAGVDNWSGYGEIDWEVLENEEVCLKDYELL